MSEPRTTDYCLRCGESPESGTHQLYSVGAPSGFHEFVDPRYERKAINTLLRMAEEYATAGGNGPERQELEAAKVILRRRWRLDS